VYGRYYYILFGVVCAHAESVSQFVNIHPRPPSRRSTIRVRLLYIPAEVYGARGGEISDADHAEDYDQSIIIIIIVICTCVVCARVFADYWLAARHGVLITVVARKHDGRGVGVRRIRPFTTISSNENVRQTIRFRTIKTKRDS